MGPPQTSIPVLLARIHGTQVGFPALAVRAIVRAVAIAPLAGAPGIIEGAFNLRGTIVPVVDLRRRLALPPAALEPDQFIIILQTADRQLAVRVDDVDDVVEIQSSDLVSSGSLSPALQQLEGVATTASGALVIYDADAFLTQAESEALDVTSFVAA